MSDHMKILAVDDEPDLRTLLKIMLTGKGYEVIEAAGGQEAVEQMRQNADVDLVIMDIMMPGMTGVEACGKIREFSTVPMLFLTAKSQLADKEEAFGAGGDDYLAKPFSRDELLIRVEALTRRYRIYKGKSENAQAEHLTLDAERRCIFRDGKALDLTDKEFAILDFFFRHRGEILDVQTVYEGVWGEKFLPSSNNTVMVHILNLRKKLEEDPANPRLIRTVWGKGYRFG